MYCKVRIQNIFRRTNRRHVVINLDDKQIYDIAGIYTFIFIFLKTLILNVDQRYKTHNNNNRLQITINENT